MPLQCNIPENSYRLQGKILKLSKIKKNKTCSIIFKESMWFLKNKILKTEV